MQMAASSAATRQSAVLSEADELAFEKVDLHDGLLPSAELARCLASVKDLA